MYNKVKKDVNKLVYDWVLSCGENGHIYPNAYVDLDLFGEIAHTLIIELYCTNGRDVIVISRVEGRDDDDRDVLTDFSLSEMCRIADACGYPDD